MALLEVRGLCKRFGGLQAVGDVSFDVPAGAVKAIIGPNGAGKTTLFNLVSGATAPDAGTVTFQGRPIQGRPPHQVAALGLSRTFQQIRLFAGMTALENVMVGAHVRGRAGFLAGMLHLPGTWREERALEERAREALAFVELDGVAGAEATSLSYGQQRGVELARAGRQLRPQQRVAIVSGHVNDQLLAAAADAGVADVLGKQDSMDALADAVRELIEGV